MPSVSPKVGAGEPGAEDDLRPGVLVVTDDALPVASTPEADHLLSSLDPGPGGLPLPACVLSVVAALRAIERNAARPGLLPRATVRTRTGARLDVHASRLRGTAGPGHVSVVLEPARAHSSAAARLAAHGLTPREVEVAVRVLRGETNRAISTALHISEHTVHDHTKSIYDKTGARGRAELAGRMLGRR